MSNFSRKVRERARDLYPAEFWTSGANEKSGVAAIALLLTIVLGCLIVFVRFV